ncbi:MAG: DUF2088 domain-containing protein, partial [Planctomycetales bacterium]|nr:DUF2088 domain-containing protein [Planctomycetales bacterium]
MTAKELVLAFGPGEQWLLPADYVTTFIDRPPVSPDLDLADEVARALESPLDFPSLHQAIVPGDVTALLLDPELPNIAELAREVVRWICEHGVSPDSLRLVISNELDAKRIQDTIHSLVGSSIPLIVHDSNDPGMLAYVAANEQADPIYFNREIVDADVIVPIISARSHGQLDFAGLFSVFPLFSNLETQQRFSNYQSLVQVERREQLEQWADQAAWWLGICVAVEVIPGRQGTVSKIIAGTLDALRGKVEQEMQSIWQVELPTCDLLIAGIDGQQQMQTWQNVARILHNAQS